MRSIKVDESHAAGERRAASLYTPSFILLLAVQCAYGMGFSVFFLLPKYLELELAASQVQIGTLAAIGALAGVISFPLVGALNDRYGRRPFVFAGSALLIGTALVLLVEREFSVLLYAARFMQGVSFALSFNSTTTLMSDRVKPAQLGVALGVFGSSMLITNALAPALAEWIAAHWGWPPVFWVSIGFCALSFALTTLVREQAREGSEHTRLHDGLALLRDPRARAVLYAIGGAGAGFGTVFVFHQPYALRVGIPRVSGFFLCYAAAALLGRMVLIRRIDGRDRQRVSALSMVVYALAVMATAALRPGLLEPVGLALGLGHGVLYPVFNALAIQAAPASARGSMMALYHGGFNGGMAVALMLGGAVADAFGYPALFLGTGSITMLCAIYLGVTPALRDLR